MATWPFWMLFLSIGAVAALVAKRLDDLERKSWAREAPRAASAGSTRQASTRT